MEILFRQIRQVIDYLAELTNYHGDKPIIFIIADSVTGQRYVISAKTADESTIRLLLAVGSRSY